MPSKKRKYNARFPAGRIKKIMQTDEEVGKVAQAVPIIISRTLELFVESLLSKAMQVTVARNAKTLSPSHVKQCILAESRFDFLRDLVKNIPDVSAAEEKEMMSAENSPNSSRFPDMPVPPRKIVREDSNSSSSCELRVQQIPQDLTRTVSTETELPKQRVETITSSVVPLETAIDLSKKREEPKPVRTANFYQETLIEQVQHRSVIKVNPTYSCPQPSTSTFTSMMPVPPQVTETVPKHDIRKPVFYLDIRQNNNLPNMHTPPRTPATPITPILNIDFSKNLDNPEIKVLDSTVAKMVGVRNEKRGYHRQSSNKHKTEIKKDIKVQSRPDIDYINSGNLQIDEDYDT